MDGPFYLRMLLSALVIIAVWNLMGPGELLGFVGNWMEKNAPYYGKPLGLCPPCCASTYGSFLWFFTGGDLFMWLPFVLALSGAMVLISRNLLKDE